MSLLLDALKKAAEKKAQKNAEDTEIESTEVQTAATLPSEVSDDTAVEETALPTETRLDTTRLDTTRAESTEFESTQVEATHVDTTTTTNIEKTVVDATERQSTEIPTHLDTTELDSKDIALTDQDEDLLIIDEDIEEDQTVVLTPDDVTEFLGDGMPEPEPVKEPEPSIPTVTYEASEDTTLTNPDSLNLTNIEQDELIYQPLDEEGNPVIRDESQTETNSLHDYDVNMSLEDISLEHPDLLEQEASTLINSEATATSSTVDIEKLTNDETLTIKDNTSTRTFAPDNYDRTLLKLADSDVSRIFPGMKSESDKVMTPDYAKKVFITKSRGVKNYYYKVYAGIAISILLIVIFWGLFEVQNESDFIDNNLVALKRDPLPGIIKPKEEKPVQLFTDIDKLVNNESPDINTNDEQQQDTEVASIADQNATLDTAQSQSIVNEEKTSLNSDGSQQSVAKEKATEPSLVTQQKTKNQQQSSPSSSAAVKISSQDRISEKDRLLSEAYAAYESGDMSVARRQYAQVISLDPENRDALLGQAAIHVYDNNFPQAVTIYQDLLVANPKDDLAMTSLISVANVDPQAGEIEIKRLLNERPESPYLHFTLGNMYGNQNRWSEAQGAYFTALQHRPEDPNYAYNLAVSLEHLEKPGSAITYYQRALDNQNKSLVTFSKELVAQRIEVLSQ